MLSNQKRGLLSFNNLMTYYFRLLHKNIINCQGNAKGTALDTLNKHL